MNYINPFNQLSSIYRILNKINGNCYIGSSLNVEKRYKHHLSTLRHNIRKAKQNTTLSQETIKKMSEAKKGKPWSEKRRAAYLKKTYNEQIS